MIIIKELYTKISKSVLFLILFFNINFLFAESYIDSYNYQINLEKIPSRIVAIGPGALRIVSYLDAVDMVVGVENIEIKYPDNRPYTISYYNKFKELPVIGEGGPDKVCDYEKIIKLKPDVIIVSSINPEYRSLIESRTGIKVFSVDYGDLGSLDIAKFKKALNLLGKLLNKQKRAEFLISRIDFYVNDLRKRTYSVSYTPSVYVGCVGFKGAHGIDSTIYNYQPFKLLGLKNVINQRGENYGHIFIDREKLLKSDPEFIFIDLGGFDIFLNDYKTSPGFYKLLKAYKKNSFYTTLPYNFYTTNVEIVFINAYFIGKVVYPLQFKDVKIKEIGGKILKDFVGRDVFDRLGSKEIYYKKLEFGKNGISFKEI